MTEKLQPEVNPDDLLSPEELTSKYSQEIADFFEIQPLEGINTVVFDSMEELAVTVRTYLASRYEALGKEGPPPEVPTYMKGYNPGGPKWQEVWMVKWGVPDERGRIMARSGFNKRLKHELTHVYLYALAARSRTEKDDYIPDWLNEGTAYLLAGQTSTDDSGEITIDRLRNLDKTFGNEKFSVGNKMAHLIVEQYGKQKLIDLINTPSHEEILKELQKMFEWLQ